MAITDPISWPRIVRRYTLLLVALITFLGLATTGYVFWTKVRSEKSLQLINDYHLATALHCADAREELHHILITGALDSVGIEKLEKRRLMGHGDNYSIPVSFQLLRQRIDEVLTLQRRFADPRFTALAERLERRFATVELKERRYAPDETKYRHATDQLVSLTVILTQLERLHIVTHDDLLMEKEVQDSRDALIFVTFILVVFLIGYLCMRVWFRALDNVVNAQKLAEDNLQASEEHLRQAQKMEAVGQLTGGVAHDFNNLLTVIQGNLELLSDRVAGDDTAQHYAQNALSSAQRGAILTGRLLAFSRKQVLMPKVIDARDLVGGMTDLLRRTLEESVEIEMIAGDGLWRCKADPIQLESALLNLAINARDAMSGSGKLTVEAANVNLDDDYAAAQSDVTPGQYVMIAVTDTGTGMPQEVIDRVFDPFFTTKEVGKGSGLGLSMVYGFVKQSGGHVTIYSEPGVGTTVKLYLPRSEEAAEELRQAEPSEALEVHGETVLVVEDDPDVRALSVTLLTSLGYDVLEAADASSALSTLETAPHVDLLFTDVVLHGSMTGLELAAEVRRRWPGLAVLYTSGYTENAIIHQGRPDDGIEFLNKPFLLEELSQKVRAAIEKSRA